MEAENFANCAILGRDAVEIRLILDEGGPVWTRAGTGHVGLTVRDSDAVYADVQKRGIAIARELRRKNWPARSFCLEDPSGNEIHIEQPDRRTALRGLESGARRGLLRLGVDGTSSTQSFC